jgi:pyridoxamine 5'-phosphate oxidase
VRVEGAVARVDAAESDEYYSSRPRGSRLGAWVSDQSRPIASRDELDAKLAEVR